MPSGSRGSPDDAMLIAGALGGASLYAECLAKKTGLSFGRIDALLDKIGHTFKLTTVSARCDGCLTTTKVFRLA